ncbi:23S rRNA (guanosine(2251)-2'-O)-methyltransferase RlmB [Tepiditoga spiralis]|uniref:23S rRNA (Guanosine(2251)-2'-O)-methyltransferase RlmB n=1 Tax=Tepiditoga spiralis TaxID=2108365 RepID=A0A7G1G6M3_9BACT|nr:23S rRNA (guanosine(2251)-2'-O)-methyltransferase RlmB [Tepiditoga spiralis]BBE32101.1 23S rRNA (guanosine(2251)-2'-O)-methyltransferase RlmB [Tepiditoga spiralis]
MYAYGRNVLKEILNAKYSIKKVYFTNSKNIDSELKKLIKKVSELGISHIFLDNEKLEELVETTKHQGVIIDIGREFNYADLNVLNSVDHEPLIVILDQISDPHNFGAVIRSAVASGVDAIIIPKNNSVEVTSTVIKVSAGQIFKLPIIKVTNLSRTIDELKKKNIWVYSADMKGTPYYELDMTYGTCIVMGNEGKGVRENVKKHSDGIVSIPMNNNVDSLNVSVSCGIILFEAKKQRDIRSK